MTRWLVSSFCIPVLVLMGGSLARAQDWLAEGRAGLVSDYRDRGYTLSDERPVMQGELTLSHADGAYVGIWGSGIDEYGVGADGDGARIEVTAYAGWAGSLGQFDLDAGLWANLYPDGDDVSYVEFPLQLSRTYGATTLSTGIVWAPSQTGTGNASNTWAWTRIDYAPEAWPVSAHATFGYENGGFAPDGKTDWVVGIEAPFGPFVVGLDLVDSSTEDRAVVGKIFRTFTL